MRNVCHTFHYTTPRVGICLVSHSINNDSSTVSSSVERRRIWEQPVSPSLSWGRIWSGMRCELLFDLWSWQEIVLKIVWLIFDLCRIVTARPSSPTRKCMRTTACTIRPRSTGEWLIFDPCRLIKITFKVFHCVWERNAQNLFKRPVVIVEMSFTYFSNENSGELFNQALQFSGYK